MLGAVKSNIKSVIPSGIYIIVLFMLIGKSLVEAKLINPFVI